MLRWSLAFFIVAIVAGMLGFTTIAGATFEIAKILFFIFAVLFAVTLVWGFVVGRGITDALRR